MKAIPGRRTHGFTLIELIITLVIASILAAMFLPYLGRTFARSHLPLIWLKDAYSLQSVMENILASHTGTLADLSTAIGPERTSQDNAFGKYDVAQNRYIGFDAGGNETGSPATNTMLKVSVRNELGEVLTRIVYSGD